MNKSIYDKRYQSIINDLRALREEKGISQKVLAETLKTDQTFISKIENFERRVDIVELKNICDALQIPFIEFISKRLNDKKLY